MGFRPFLVAAVAGFALFVISCRSHDDNRALHLGRLEIAAEKYGYLLPAVDEVRLFAFSDKGAEQTRATFRVAYFESEIAVTNEIHLISMEATDFADHWRNLDFSWRYSAMCFEPGFGLQFRHHGKNILETAICVNCSNFYVPTRNGFALCGFRLRNSSGSNFIFAVHRAFAASKGVPAK